MSSIKLKNISDPILRRELPEIFDKLKSLGYNSDSKIAKAINVNLMTVGRWRRLEVPPEEENLIKLKQLASQANKEPLTLKTAFKSGLQMQKESPEMSSWEIMQAVGRVQGNLETELKHVKNLIESLQKELDSTKKEVLVLKEKNKEA